MAAVDINEDVAQAVKALWMATPGLGQNATDGTTLSVSGAPFRCGELKAGRLIAGTGLDSSNNLVPYGQFEVKMEEGHEAERGTGGYYLAYNKVTIWIRGLKADATNGLRFLMGTFNLALGTPGKPTLVMPSGAKFMQWQPQQPGDREIETSQKQANEIWSYHVIGKVKTVRTDT